MSVQFTEHLMALRAGIRWSSVSPCYPQAVTAFLGGSAASGDATDSSDLDILMQLGSEFFGTVDAGTLVPEKEGSHGYRNCADQGRRRH